MGVTVHVCATVHICATGHYFLAGMFTHLKPSVYISPRAETLVGSHRALRSLDESSAAWVDARMAIIILFFLDYRNQSGMVPIWPVLLFCFSFNSIFSLELLVFTL